MLKKSLSIFLAVLLILTSCMTSLGGNRVYAAETAEALPLGIPGAVFSLPATSAGGSDIAIDGILNESNWKMDGSGGRSLDQKSLGDSDNTVVFDTAWDENNLYVAIKVADANVIPNGDRPDNLWNEDTVEIFIDGDNKKSGTYDDNDNQIFIGCSGMVHTTRGGTQTDFGNEIQTAAKVTDGGYCVEVSIPWASIGVTNPAEGTIIGFDVANDDCDETGAGRNSVLCWNDSVNGNWQNTSTFGTLVLAEKNIPVASGKGTPEVDGDVSEWNLTRSIAESSTNGAYNNTLQFDSRCDKDYLYFGVKVLDSGLVNDPANESWNNDAVEIYLDGANNKVSGSPVQISVHWQEEDFINVNNGITTALKNFEGGYGIEVRVPWAAIGVTPADKQVLGFDICNNDNDGSVDDKVWIAWNGNGNNWQSTAAYGSLILNNPEVQPEPELPYGGIPYGTFTDVPGTYDENNPHVKYTNVFIYNGDPLTGAYANVWTEEGADLLYSSPSGDILSVAVETADDWSEGLFSLSASEDGSEFVMITPAAIQTANVGWMRGMKYHLDFFSSGERYRFVKVHINTDDSNAYAAGIWKVAFDYRQMPLPTADALVRAVTTQGTAVWGTVNAHSDQGPLTYSIETQPRHGTVEIDESSGRWEYTPEPDFVGDYDGFVAEVKDIYGSTVSSSVEVFVNYAATNREYYVSAESGDNSGDGSEAHPFSTIQHAADMSCPGDTIYIMNGTYGDDAAAHGEGVAVLSRSGLPGAYITFKAYPGHKPVLKSTTSWNHLLITGCYIVVQGLTIEGNSDNITREQAMAKYDKFCAANEDPNDDLVIEDWSEYGPTNANGISIRPDSRTERIPHHIVIRDCEVSKCPGAGIGSDKADYITFENNLVYDNCKWNFYANSGISIFHPVDYDGNTTGYRNIIRNNRSFNNANTIPWYVTNAMSDGNGIILDDTLNTQDTGIPYRGKTLITNNVVYHNGGSGIHAYSSTNVDIVNNTAYNNNQTDDLRWGQIYANSSKDVNILNNILYAREGYPVNDNYGNSNVVYDYNIYYNGTSPKVAGPHDILADPKFVSIQEGDFRLSTGSPAIDAGTSELAPAVDYAGKSRPQGSGVDIGAYEFIAETENPTDPTPTPTPTLAPVVVNPEAPEVKADVLLSGDSATVAVKQPALDAAFALAKKEKDGRRTAVVKISAPEGTQSFTASLPQSYFTSGEKNKLEIATPVGNVILSGDMLDKFEVAASAEISLVIKKTDSKKLDTAVEKSIGDRPILDIYFTVDGKPIHWNSERPISISIDYTPTAEEMAHPDNIVIWYVDSDGKLNPVYSGKYDEAAGKVSFVTNHFSLYAVGFVRKTLHDMEAYSWAKAAAELVVSRGMMEGTPAQKFIPQKAVTRGEAVDALVKALGLYGGTEIGFSDVPQKHKYAHSIAIARELGIVSGYRNQFNPDAEITRQDFMVMIDKALKVAGKTLTPVGSRNVAIFEDFSQISDYAVQAAGTLYGSGIVAGTGSRLMPRKAVTRAEAAVLIDKVYKIP